MQLGLSPRSLLLQQGKRRHIIRSKQIYQQLNFPSAGFVFLHATIGGQLHSSLHLSCSTVHPLNLCGICTSWIRSQFSEPHSLQTWEQSLSFPRNPEMSRAWKSSLSYVFTRVGLAHGGCGKNSAVSVVAGEEIAHQEHHGQAFHDLRMRC